MSSPRSTADPLFDGGGDMARLIAGHDWASTELGVIPTWSPSLWTATAILLRSRYPMLLTWGPELVMLYNDDFVPTLGDKHPAALGRPLREQYAEVWDVVGPMQTAILAGGPAVWDEDLALVVERGDEPEEAFFTFSYSHVPCEHGDGPGGVLTVVAFTTEKVVAARRLDLLNRLAGRTDLTDVSAAVATCVETLDSVDTELHHGALYLPGGPDLAPALARAGSFGDVPPGTLPDQTDGSDGSDGSIVRAWQDQVVVVEELETTPGDGRPRRRLSLPVRGRDGVSAVLVVAPNPLRPADDEQQRFLGLVADQVGQMLGLATARAEEQARVEALAAIDAAKSSFLSSVSHELRTPLTLILGPLEDALNGRVATIERDDLEVMHASAHRLLRLVGGLLDVARVESDTLVAVREPTDVAELTADLLGPFLAAASRAGMHLDRDLDPDIGVIDLDPELWEKILLNLVGNALKYTHEGSVTVSLTVADSDLVLTVADTGLGIPEPEVDRVFDRFHRVRTPESGYAEGTGLGLALVADAAAALGGWVQLVTQLGAGSSFTVVVPLRPSTGAPHQLPPTRLDAARAPALDLAPTADAPDPSYDGAREGAAGPLVLVVEDNPAMRDRLARVLAPLGTIRRAADGVAAWEVLGAEPVDLVVTDVMMPRMGGIGLLKAIRSEPSLAHLPVVVLSARAGAEAATGALEARADDYVVKPFTSEELLARCRASLEMATLRAEVAATGVRATVLAGVSHDMQTPLAVINGALEMLDLDGLTDEQRERVTGRARAGAQRLSRLVTQFLDWSRLTAGVALDPLAEPTDLRGLAERVAQQHDRVVVLIEEDLVVTCDPGRTEQILHNLVENALRVARTQVVLQVTRVGQEAAVHVDDDGVGVEARVLPHLFEAFGPSSHRHGNGLGLHVSRQAARAQGGELALAHTGERGSVFVLTMPLAGIG
ncbi:hypothetical protein NPS01_26470 [Nocardioides psychrotolerans]|uniref:histidine kinase n=1 Tax=Nocardioides psychrotolerans TaxID=1005945 RepID=A0A1I3M0T2_9ACTN|nr:ATP-binding protein [Nocardioides psychrotolerans]GEP38984.1 hypothetical protein NPS01_26470 [Nocardioides psychrotolerans]SFI90573.1 GAF domain-containing protein [Nocardioides psychrotolerans]